MSSIETSGSQAPRPLTESELLDCSAAALMVHDQRRQVGNRSTYDLFMIDYVGGPALGATDIPPISQVTPSGQQITYNNPHNVRKGYTEEGTLLDVRWAEGELPPGLEQYRLFVATADMRTATTTVWQPISIERHGLGGHQVILLREKLAQLSLIGAAHTESDDALQRILAIKQRHGRELAQLILNPAGTNLFVPVVGPSEAINPMEELVREVNRLRDRENLDLDALAQRAKQGTNNVVQLQARAA
jgi:hypothetical protein